ncbi:MAG: hypothetical protein K2H84_01775, partial [Paramuribaculum sp.]|nr:hypothetical protein [Paramuribaculum sp.]
YNSMVRLTTGENSTMSMTSNQPNKTKETIMTGISYIKGIPVFLLYYETHFRFNFDNVSSIIDIKCL